MSGYSSHADVVALGWAHRLIRSIGEETEAVYADIHDDDAETHVANVKRLIAALVGLSAEIVLTTTGIGRNYHSIVDQAHVAACKRSIRLNPDEPPQAA